MEQLNSSSGTSIHNQPASSASQPTDINAYLKKIEAQMKPQTTAQIKAHGEVKTKLGVLWFIGVICTSLILVGGVAMVVNPEQSKDVWIIIGPILSSAVMGTIAFLTGEKMTSKK